MLYNLGRFQWNQLHQNYPLYQPKGKLENRDVYSNFKLFIFQKKADPAGRV